MIREDIIIKIRSARGEMVVEMLGWHDVYHVKIVKTDLINMFKEKFKPYEETGFEILCKDDTYYCVRDYNIA